MYDICIGRERYTDIHKHEPSVRLAAWLAAWLPGRPAAWPPGSLTVWPLVKHLASTPVTQTYSKHIQPYKYKTHS